eukprot:7197254-Heterocapsa_arctica.AAC.1
MPKPWLPCGNLTVYYGPMPCVGGSPWQKLSRLRTGGQAKVDAHIHLFDQIWKQFKHVALECIKH